MHKDGKMKGENPSFKKLTIRLVHFYARAVESSPWPDWCSTARWYQHDTGDFGKLIPCPNPTTEPWCDLGQVTAHLGTSILSYVTSNCWSDTGTIATHMEENKVKFLPRVIQKKMNSMWINDLTVTHQNSETFHPELQKNICIASVWEESSSQNVKSQNHRELSDQWDALKTNTHPNQSEKWSYDMEEVIYDHHGEKYGSSPTS